jgi:hypothetical protein
MRFTNFDTSQFHKKLNDLEKWKDDYVRECWVSIRRGD